MGSQYHLDAAESAFFERQLEYIKARTYDVKYPTLKSRMFVPVSNEAGPGALEVTYRQWDRVGRAKIGAPGATDAPRVDVLANEFPRPVRLVTDSYGYHLIEIRNAQLAGKPLNARRASVARRAIEEVLDEVAAIGSAVNGIPTGFINDANVTIDAATGNWSALTADQIIADVSTMYQGIVTDSLGIHKPNTLVLPEAQWALIATLPRAATSDTTVMEFIMRSFPMITAIEPWYRLAGAGALGVDRAILYDRSDETLVQDIPSEFEQLPVFQRGQNFEVECMATTAGTAIHYVGAVRYMDGI